jgi:pilus assembly protein CpaE
VLEISRKDFEGSIERKIDLLIPFEQKIAAQAAKLGKPLAEAGKSAKSLAPLTDLATRITVITDSGERDDKAAPAKGPKGSSLFDKIKVKMPSKAKK